MEATMTTGAEAEAEHTNGEGEGENLEEFVTGTDAQLTLNVGGKAPQTSRLSMGSKAIDVSGQFKKGTVLELRVIARIDEVKLTDSHDEYGTVTATVRTHVAKVLTVENADIVE